MEYFARDSRVEAQVKIKNFLAASILACNLTYQTYAIDEIHKTRKLMNNSIQSPQLQSTNVNVHVHNHNHFNLNLAIALPVGAGAILSVLGWAIYKLCNKKPTQQAEEAEIVAEIPSIQKVAEDISAIEGLFERQ